MSVVIARVENSVVVDWEKFNDGDWTIVFASQKNFPEHKIEKQTVVKTAEPVYGSFQDLKTSLVSQRWIL